MLSADQKRAFVLLYTGDKLNEAKLKIEENVNNCNRKFSVKSLLVLPDASIKPQITILEDKPPHWTFFYLSLDSAGSIVETIQQHTGLKTWTAQQFRREKFSIQDILNQLGSEYGEEDLTKKPEGGEKLVEIEEEGKVIEEKKINGQEENETEMVKNIEKEGESKENGLDSEEDEYYEQFINSSPCYQKAKIPYVISGKCFFSKG